MDRAVYDRMAAIDAEHWWFRGRRRIIDALIRRRVKPDRPLRILEVGCGTGSNIPLLQRYGPVEAVEPDAETRALAARRTGVAVRGGFLPDEVDLPDAAFDLIVLFDVLEHIPDDLGTLKALRSKLAPGGSVLLTVPAMPWLWSAHDVAHHHRRRYTAAALREQAERAGYRIDYLGHFNTILLPLIIAARLVGRLTGRGGGDDAVPPPLINRWLEHIFGAEAAFVGRLSLPAGVSLACVLRPA